MKNRYWFLIAVLLLLIASAPFAAAIFTQEGNPLPVVVAIIRLEVTGQNIVQMSEYKMLQKAGADIMLHDYLAVHGWDFQEQLGSGLLYQKNSYQLFVHMRMLTRRYTVFEFDRSI